MRLDYAIEGYWLAKRRDFSANTINDYTLTFKRLTEFVGKTWDLKDISSEDINCFLNHLRDDLELSRETLLNHWIARTSFWTWVERDLGLPHIIRGKVNRPRPRRQLSAAYTEAEIRGLLAACDKEAGWDRAHGQRAGVPDAGAHRFRHTFAVNFLRNGGNLLALQDLLGHERMDTVRMYARQAEVDLERQKKGASLADRWRL